MINNIKQYNLNIITKFTNLIELLKKINKIETNPKIKIINNFRIKHLTNALHVITNLNLEINLNNIYDINFIGIGKGTINRIVEILETGELEELYKLTEIYASKNINLVIELNNVIGIGDKKAIDLIKKYNIKSVIDLKNQIKKGIIQFKDNSKILLALKYYGKYEANIPRQEINNIYIFLEKFFNNLDNKIIFIICGSYRRNNLISRDIDILIVHTNLYTLKDVIHSHYLYYIVNNLKKFNFIIDDLTETNGGTKYMGFCKFTNHPIRRIDIRIVGIESFFPALIYFTGSYELNRKLRLRANKIKYKLNEYGLYDENHNNILLTSEKQLFDILNVEYLSPDQRNI
jgi:DNA polymerase/3'-5' exonuclease PolX